MRNIFKCLFSLMSQLTDSIKAYFPAILTRKYGYDLSIIILLRGRTLGNSPIALRNGVLEVHSEYWLNSKKQLSYISDCERHR